MPAQSKAQQRFMGMVHAADKGETPASPEVAKVSKDMDDTDAKDFASTSHKGLPDKIKEMVLAELRSVRAIQTDYAKVLDAMEKQLSAYKQSKGTPSEKQHIQQLKTLTIQKKKLSAELDAKVSGMWKDAELKVDEMNTTGNVQGYGTPHAFGKGEDEKTKGKRQADLTGYSVVKEGKYYVTYNKGRGQGKGLEKEFDQKSFKTTDKPKVFNSYKDAKEYAEKMEKMFKHSIGGGTAYWVSDEKMNPILRESVNENRWLELKKDESTAQSKIGRGISNINKQLAEMERFLNWYGKIKNESGVDNKSYWKRTNSHIYSIKERLLKLDQKIRQISE
jgi:hypothetical protein